MTDLERFVEQPGRAEAIAEVARRIEDEGVTYVYFQFVSVTGRVMGKGIPESRITVKWRGKEEPIADNKTVAGRALNRRAEIKQNN